MRQSERLPRKSGAKANFVPGIVGACAAEAVLPLKVLYILWNAEKRSLKKHEYLPDQAHEEIIFQGTVDVQHILYQGVRGKAVLLRCDGLDLIQ